MTLRPDAGTAGGKGPSPESCEGKLVVAQEVFRKERCALRAARCPCPRAIPRLGTTRIPSSKGVLTRADLSNRRRLEPVGPLLLSVESSSARRVA